MYFEGGFPVSQTPIYSPQPLDVVDHTRSQTLSHCWGNTCCIAVVSTGRDWTIGNAPWAAAALSSMWAQFANIVRTALIPSLTHPHNTFGSPRSDGSQLLQEHFNMRPPPKARSERCCGLRHVFLSASGCRTQDLEWVCVFLSVCPST